MAKTKKTKNSILLGFAERERGPSGKWRIKFRMGRIVAFFVLLAVGSYVGLTLMFYAIMKYKKGFEDITLADSFAYPLNREEFREKRGDFHIELAKEQIEDEAFAEAYANLRTGVFLSPENTEGRLLLTEFHLAARERELAVQTMINGLAYATEDPDYLQSFVAVMLRYQRDSDVVEAAEQILASDPSDEIREIMATGAARAHYFRGNYDACERMMDTYGISESLSGTLLTARINWLRGDQKEALKVLKQGAETFPNKDIFYRELYSNYKQMEDLGAAKRYATLRNVNAPLSVGPRIDLLSIWSLTGQQARATEEAYEILRQFSQDEAALSALGQYATESGDVDLMTRIYSTALESDFEIANFALQVIEAHIKAKDYEGAVKYSEDLAKENPDWLQNRTDPGIFNSLRAIAYYGMGNEDLSKLYLDQFLKFQNLRPSRYLAIARRFRELGGPHQALQILEHAYNLNPDNQNALTQLIALELELGNSTEVGPYLQRLLEMRRPSQEVLREAYERLGSDRFIFTPDREQILVELNKLLAKTEREA